jgi:hypothetical protein
LNTDGDKGMLHISWSFSVFDVCLNWESLSYAFLETVTGLEK